ncbi:MAG: EAL domain-containing protein [Parvibaculaceae bacterium]
MVKQFRQHILELPGRMSVKWKILAPFCALVAVIGLLLIGAFFIFFMRYHETAVAQRAEDTSLGIVYALETMGSFSELERYVTTVAAEPDVDLILVVEPGSGKVLLSNRRALQGLPVANLPDGDLKDGVRTILDDPSRLQKLSWSGDVATYAASTSTLMFEGNKAVDLTVFVRLRTRYVTAQSSLMAQQLGLVLLVGLSLAMLVVSRVLFDLVISPLLKLTDIAQTRAVDAETMEPFTRRRDEFGQLARSVLSSFTEARENAERFARLAQSDTLTGLGNRVMFKDRLKLSLARAERSGKSVALMVLDLDNFKDVNDTLGHDIGDKLLMRVADILRENSRATDTVVRLGGDEFAIIVDELERVDNVVAQANRILAALSQIREIGGHDVHPGASIGITAYPQDGREGEVLLKNADLALYRAKAEGRKNIQFYRHELHLRVVERNAIERDLRAALADGQFELFYQPKIDLKTGKVAGAEALIRWRHPDRGMIPPDVFIPVAEKNGLVCDLTDWVLDEACRQVRSWMDQGIDPVPVAINVSALDLRRPEFTDRVAATLVHAGVSPKYLEIEVTESTMMHDVDQVIGTLRRLRALGVSISIDDFGTGYSSLAYLKQFPVQRLKIDRSFVNDMSDDVNTHAIPQLIIDLARNLGVSVLAEGVETDKQRVMLTEMGCQEAQGYLFSAPIPSASFEELLRAKTGFSGADAGGPAAANVTVVSVA